MLTDVDTCLHASLLGLALGDAVGAPFEGLVRVDPGAIRSWLDADDELRWTDDTHMAMALAGALVDRHGAVEAQHLGAAFAAAYADEPWRGYGAGPPRIFALAADGMPYVEAAASLFGGTGSFGNGAAMRVAPVSLAAGNDPGRAADLAVGQAVVTHAHAEAVDGAVYVATAITHLAIARPTPTSIREALVRATAQLRPGIVRDEVRSLLDDGARGDDLLVPTRLQDTGVAARESVPAAVAAVLAGSDLTTTLLAAVGLGGDTDTIAAMAGALAGAAYGRVPNRLTGRLEAEQELRRLAAALVAIGGASHTGEPEAMDPPGSAPG